MLTGNSITYVIDSTIACCQSKHSGSFNVITVRQHAPHAQRDIVMANPSCDIRPSVRLSDCLHVCNHIRGPVENSGPAMQVSESQYYATSKAIISNDEMTLRNVLPGYNDRSLYLYAYAAQYE